MLLTLILAIARPPAPILGPSVKRVVQLRDGAFRAEMADGTAYSFQPTTERWTFYLRHPSNPAYAKRLPANQVPDHVQEAVYKARDSPP